MSYGKKDVIVAERILKSQCVWSYTKKKNRLSEFLAKTEITREVLERFVRGFAERYCKYIIIINSEQRRKIEFIQKSTKLWLQLSSCHYEFTERFWRD